jgi:plastocyanin
MKNNITLAAVACLFAFNAFAQTTHTIISSGITYSPNNLTVNVGDNVVFNSSFANHPLHEVSQATWNAGGSTQLAGGFSATTGTTLTVPITTTATRFYVCSFHVGSGMKGKIVVNTVGTDKVAQAKMATYPMPAAHLLHIATSLIGTVTYNIVDLQGKTVLSGSANAQTNEFVTVDVSAIANGFYVLNLQDDKQTLDTQKIMIAR